MFPLRQSTSSQEVPIGISIADPDLTVKLFKAGSISLATKIDEALFISDGVYLTTLDATDTSTPGPLVIFCAGTRVDCTVLPTKVYDSMFGSSVLEVDLVSVGGTLVESPDDLKADLTDLLTLAEDWEDGGRLDLILDTASQNSLHGVNMVTIDAGQPDIDVHVYDSSNVVWITSGTTDQEGTCTLYLNDGPYKVRLRSPGVNYTTPETLIVLGDTEVSYEGSVVPILVPEDSDTCQVYEFCYQQGGATPLPEVSARCTITSLPYDYDGKLHSGSATDGTYNATTGYLYWDVVRGASVLIQIPELGVSVRKVIPDAASVRVASL